MAHMGMAHIHIFSLQKQDSIKLVDWHDCVSSFHVGPPQEKGIHGQLLPFTEQVNSGPTSSVDGQVVGTHRSSESGHVTSLQFQLSPSQKQFGEMVTSWQDCVASFHWPVHVTVDDALGHSFPGSEH
jgi:hypothetical protein